jgi:hypothetical protein
VAASRKQERTVKLAEGWEQISVTRPTATDTERGEEPSPTQKEMTLDGGKKRCEVVYWTCYYRYKMTDGAYSPHQQGNDSNSNPIQGQLAVSERQGNISDWPL